MIICAMQKNVSGGRAVFENVWFVSTESVIERGKKIVRKKFHVFNNKFTVFRYKFPKMKKKNKNRYVF